MYLWNAATGDIVQLCQTETPDCYISSVAWIKEGNYIALGDSNGVVQVGATTVLFTQIFSLPQKFDFTQQSSMRDKSS